MPRSRNLETYPVEMLEILRQAVLFDREIFIDTSDIRGANSLKTKWYSMVKAVEMVHSKRILFEVLRPATQAIVEEIGHEWGQSAAYVANHPDDSSRLGLLIKHKRNTKISMMFRAALAESDERGPRVAADEAEQIAASQARLLAVVGATSAIVKNPEPKISAGQNGKYLVGDVWMTPEEIFTQNRKMLSRGMKPLIVAGVTDSDGRPASDGESPTGAIPYA